jgi:hypothetical protein
VKSSQRENKMMKGKFKKTKIFLALIVVIILILSIKASTVKFDVTDEAIINASPSVVFKAIVDQDCGKSNWGMPDVFKKPREDSACGIGDLIDVTLYQKSGRPPLKFTTKTVEVIKDEKIYGKYVEGPFRGEYLWSFKDLGDKTKLSFQWRTKPHSLVMKILSLFVPIEKAHSDHMRTSYVNLNKFLEQNNKTKINSVNSL